MGGLGSWRKDMNHFEYVTRKEAAHDRVVIEEIIHEVQKEVGDYFTFSYRIIGSTKRNMITKNEKSNTGFLNAYSLNIVQNFKL